MKDKIALVTGGSRGIGRAIALALADAGAHVALAARDTVALRRVANEVRARGQRANVIPCDVTDNVAVEKLPLIIKDNLGAVDILINNAGISGSHKLEGHPDDLWDRMLDVNLTAVYHVTKAFIPDMTKRNSGRIIMIASIAGKVGLRYATAYAASKHGVLGIMRSLALELTDHNITVNAVCPGYVDTSMTDGTVANIMLKTSMSERQARNFLHRSSPQNRLIEPQEVAAVAVMLASEAAHGITGQAINVDGGAVTS